MNSGTKEGRTSDPPRPPDPDSVSVAHKDFAKLPCAVARAVIRGDLDYHEHSVLTFIIGAMDWRTGEYVSTAQGLADAIKWPHTEDYLTKVVRSIVGKGWLNRDTRSGPRAPWIITIGPRMVAALTQGAVAEVVSGVWLGEDNVSSHSEIHSEIPSETSSEIQSEIVSDQKPPSVPPSPELNGDTTTLNLGTSLPPIEEDVEADKYIDPEEHGEAVSSGEGRNVEPEALTPHLRAAIRTARERQPEGKIG